MFLVFALLTLGGALALCVQRNAVQAGLCMLLSFFGIAGLFLLLANPVAAALQIIIYSGAITILVLFVVMLLQSHKEEPVTRPMYLQKAFSIILVTVMAIGAVGLVLKSEALAGLQAASLGHGNMTLQKLGGQLFSEHLVSLEAVGLLLLSAMVAAVLLVKKEV